MKYSDLFYALRKEEGDSWTKDAMDGLAGRLVDLSQVALSVTCDKTMTSALLKGLSLLDTERAPELYELKAALERVLLSRDSGGFSCFFRSHDIEPFDLERALWGNEGSIKAFLLLGLSSLASRLLKLRGLGVRDGDLDALVYRGLAETAGTFPYKYMADILRETGIAGLRSEELLAEVSAGTEDASCPAPDAEGIAACLKAGCAAELVAGGSGDLRLSCSSFELEGGKAFRFLEEAASWSSKPEICISLTSSSAVLLVLECAALGFRQINISPYPDFIAPDVGRLLERTFGIR